MKRYDSSIVIECWDDFVKLSKENNNWRNWIFRGQSNYKWDLKTSIERVAESYRINFNELHEYEMGLLRKFKRHYSHYSTHVPEKSDNVRWLSLMQHYGAPTRMLDFSYSIFVALFFAIENVVIDSDCSIWSINVDWVIKEKYQKEKASTQYKDLLDDDKLAKGTEINNVLLNDEQDYIYSINPVELNERLIIQQGVFVIPLNIKKRFMDNLDGVIEKEHEIKYIKKMRIKCDELFIEEAYYHLNRMNINRATLFPGLEGFSRYLKMLFLIKETIAYDTLKFE